jgi:hypothetical protein
VVTHEEPQPHYEGRFESQQGSSSQQDDTSPSPVAEWGQVADLLRPAFYGKSWTPAVRIAMILAVLAIVAVVVLALALLIVMVLK